MINKKKWRVGSDTVTVTTVFLRNRSNCHGDGKNVAKMRCNCENWHFYHVNATVAVAVFDTNIDDLC